MEWDKKPLRKKKCSQTTDKSGWMFVIEGNIFVVVVVVIQYTLLTSYT